MARIELASKIVYSKKSTSLADLFSPESESIKKWKSSKILLIYPWINFADNAQEKHSPLS